MYETVICSVSSRFISANLHMDSVKQTLFLELHSLPLARAVLLIKLDEKKKRNVLYNRFVFCFGCLFAF